MESCSFEESSDHQCKDFFKGIYIYRNTMVLLMHPNMCYTLTCALHWENYQSDSAAMLCISIFITITSHHRPSDCLFNSMPASRNYQNSLLLVLCMQKSPAIGGFPHKIPVIQKTCPYHCVVEENFFYFSVAYYESCNKDFIHATEMFVICLITLRMLKPEYYSEIESISWLLVLLTSQYIRSYAIHCPR